MFVVQEDGKDADGKPKQKAVQTFVETGPHFAGRIAILRGVEAGDAVVASGQIKLQNGAPVTVTAEAALTPAAPPNGAAGGRGMKFTDLFVRRPVLAAVVSLLILLIGLRALFELPVRQYPELKNTVITGHDRPIRAPPPS